MLELRDYQKEAVLFLTRRQQGCVVAPAGSGKTIIGAAAAAIEVAKRYFATGRAPKLFWLCNTIEQCQQGAKALEHTPCSAPAEIEVCCYASQPDLSEADIVIVDECFPAGTRVDGRPIESIREGETVWAFNHDAEELTARRVLRTMSSEYHGRWVRIRTKDGAEVVCTEGHPLYVRGVGYVPAIMLRHFLGDDVHLYLHRRPSNLEMLSLRRHREVEAPESLPRLAPIGPSVLHESVLPGDSSRRKLENDDKNQSEESPDSLRPYEGAKSNDVSGDSPESERVPQGSAFPDGARRERSTVQASTCAGRRHWTSDGAGDSHSGSKHAVLENSPLLQGGCSGRGMPAGNRGGWNFSPNFERQGARPSENGGVVSTRLDNVEVYERGSDERPLWVPRENRVYNLEVEGTHNYFAGGLLVHNCHHVPAETLGKTLARIKPGATLWGLTATPTHEDPERNQLVESAFQQFFFIARERVEASGHLIKGKVYLHDLDAPGQFDAEIEREVVMEVRRRIVTFPRIPAFEHYRRVQWQVTQEKIQANPARNAAAVQLAAGFATAGESVLMLVHSIEHGEELAGQIPGSACVHSKLGKKVRRELIESLRSGERRVLIATSLADEGLDVPRASRLILVAGGRSAGKLEQRAGRVLRPFAGKNGGEIHDFLDRGAVFAHAQAKARMKVYERLGYEPEVLAYAAQNTVSQPAAVPVG